MKLFDMLALGFIVVFKDEEAGKDQLRSKSDITGPAAPKRRGTHTEGLACHLPAESSPSTVEFQLMHC